MARWLVTGGAGFIGSHIAETLVSLGEKVRVLDNFFAGKKEYLSNIWNKIEVIHGDIREMKTLRRAVKDMDFVSHHAALRSVPRSVENPREANAVNVEGTLNCLVASHRAKVKRFIFASSSSIYGDSNQFPQRETEFPSPISPYAVSKLAGEYYCRVFSKTYGLSAVALRYFNVFGPRQDPKSRYAAVIPRFIIAALKGAPLEVHWDGKQSRDFTYVGNVVKANLLAAKSNNLKHLVYNVGCGGSTSLLEIIAILEKIMGQKLKKKFFPRRAGDVRKTWGDISRIARDLKFGSPVQFEAGLRKTFDFFSENNRWRKY